MYNFKGTPGTWQESEFNDTVISKSRDIVTADERKGICTVWGLGGSIHPVEKEAKANANLIVNSKGLLEASIELHSLHMCEQEGIGAGMPTPEQWMEAVQKLENVINKILTYEE